MSRRPTIVSWYVLCAATAARASAGDPAPPAQHIEAGPVRLELSLDRAAMNVAQTLRLRLRVQALQGVRVDLPAPQEKLGGFLVTGVHDDPPVAAADGTALRTTFARELTIEPFLPGNYEVPAIEVPWTRPATGEHGVARTAPIAVRVLSLLPDAAPGAPPSLDPGPIRGAYEPTTALSWRPALLLGTGAVAGLALGGAGLWALRRRRTGDVMATLERRVRVLAGPLPAGVSGRQACDEIGTCVRLALADRIHPGAPSLTPAELAKGPASPAAMELLGRAAELLARLDTARFAGEAIDERDVGPWAETAMSLLASLRSQARPRQHEGARA